MKFLITQISTGAVLFSLGVLSLTGCGNTLDSSEFHEFTKTKTITPELDSPNPNSSDANSIPEETHFPAVAQKVDQPAVAEFSPGRINLASAKTPADPSNPNTLALAKPEPREIKLLIPNKTFIKDRRDGSLRVSYDDIDLLKILNMEPVPLDAADHLPDWLAGLEGKRIRIRGYMFPAFQETDIRVFSFVRDNEICCYVRVPKIYDKIRVEMKEGTSTEYLPNRPFDVAGTFHIKPMTIKGVLFGFYELRDASVITR